MVELMVPTNGIRAGTQTLLEFPDLEQGVCKQPTIAMVKNSVNTRGGPSLHVNARKDMRW